MGRERGMGPASGMGLEWRVVVILRPSGSGPVERLAIEDPSIGRIGGLR
jgi:hypothetical protein